MMFTDRPVGVMRIKRFSGAALVFLLFLAPPGWCQQDLMRGPWDRGGQPIVQTGSANSRGNAGTALVSFYRRFISPIDGTNCPMYPSDSTYAVRCFQRHGFLMGWIMTIDRLYRCGRDELNLSPVVFVKGQAKCFDPVRRNDFWWYHETR